MVAALGDDVAAVDANVAAGALVAAAHAGTMIAADGGEAPSVDGDPLVGAGSIASPAAPAHSGRAMPSARIVIIRAAGGDDAPVHSEGASVFTCIAERSVSATSDGRARARRAPGEEGARVVAVHDREGIALLDSRPIGQNSVGGNEAVFGNDGVAPLVLVGH